ncbi:MAG: MG2 domain-containing protein, partial [Bacteroidota bacterium]
FGDYYINRGYDDKQPDKERHNTYLFTDRSIYRPGQTVYFKGIVTKTFKENTKVFEEHKATISLHNVNGEELSDLEVVSNEFGSFHETFVLPNDGLTGNFYIRVSSSDIGEAYQYFSVEEYKRPKFKAEFLPITETFKVNDDITVKGNALAFAGSTITNAKVTYRVKRNVQFPRWYYWSRPYYKSEAQEITFGETTTNDKGEFEIPFTALPDNSVDKTDLPIFQYEITADVTDINGETRSATTVVNLGYHSITANIIVPDQLDKMEKEHEITIQSQNLNGEYAAAKGTLSIYKLKGPDRTLRPRPWEAPDYQVIPENEFKALFPHEAYDDEKNIQNWEKGQRVFQTEFDTELSKTVTLKRTKNWDSGLYIIVLESEDKFGQAIKDEAYTTLFSDKDASTLDNKLFSVKLDKSSYAINSMAEITFASAGDIVVTVDVEKDYKVIKTHILKLNNSKTKLSIPINPEDVGGFAIKYSYAAYNYFKEETLGVPIPYPDTELQIETQTFRDKLKPGEDETWSFTIKGPKGDKVSAELLASMYDASLDEFRSHQWQFNPISRPKYRSDWRSYKNAAQSFGTTQFRLFNNFKPVPSYPAQAYDQFNWFGFYFGSPNRYLTKNYKTENRLEEAVMVVSDVEAPNDAAVLVGAVEKELNSLSQQNDTDTWTTKNSDDTFESAQTEAVNFDNIPIRKNLQETAFFFPQLQTDTEGNVSFNFTAPEALTKWKLQLLAHTKTLESSVKMLETVTQKELMVIPNAPRFLREGDVITISTKISNLTESALNGDARLELSDAITGNTIDDQLGNIKSTQSFTVDAKGNTQVSWTLNIPTTVQAVQYKVIAKAESFSDGEQNALPVLSNRMLVTETLPMWVRSNETRTFTLNKLKNNTSTTLKHHKLTLEMTSNPAWYAVQALPYLMEYPYDCNEQTFARYYSNALARHIVSSNPKIEAMFNQWKSQDALLSNLEKNQELKSLLIQETPWLRDAQSESEQKKRIGLLFDLNTMTNELQLSLNKLKSNQSPAGGWPWFKGGRDSRYITQHIISGFGHLKQLGVTPNNAEMEMVRKALTYLDEQFVEEYENLKKYNDKVDLSKDHLSYMQLHYLYVRSFYPDITANKELESIMNYYHSQIKSYWLSQPLYAKGLMTLATHRMGDSKTSNKIIKSLKQNSITSDELGMYWKENTNSWYWYQAPIETQALMIEALSEIENDTETIDNLKIWLLKHKQTNQWETTKSTTEAIYALLLRGSEWLSVTDMVDVKVA